MEKRILIIEDDKDILENTMEILQLAGFSVLTAQDGALGLKKIETEHPHAVLCDIRMSQLDGYRVFEKFKRVKENTSVKFIFFSANVEKRDIDKALEMGIDGYIKKPFDPEELITTLKSCLEKQPGA